MRLETVVALTPACESAVDVGADHAQVAIALARSGRVSRLTATDCAAGPLRRAAGAIRAAGLADRIQTAQTDGLTGLPKHDTVIVAGMGGELILHILETAPWVRDSDVTCILQPMTMGERLRAGLAERGFRVVREVIAAERGRLYPVLAVMRGDERIERADQLWLSRAGDADPNAKPYLEKTIARLKRARAGRARATAPDAAALLELDEAIAALAARRARL